MPSNHRYNQRIQRMPTLTERAQRVAKNCEDAYSADRYRSWKQVALLLLKAGYTEQEAEAIMRSKVTRWAADAADFVDNASAQCVIDYINDKRNGVDKAYVDMLTRETFAENPKPTVERIVFPPKPKVVLQPATEDIRNAIQMLVTDIDAEVHEANINDAVQLLKGALSKLGG